jgi:hypothetical protein
MSQEKYPVQLVNRLGEDSRGVFVLDEENDGDDCRLLLEHPGGAINASALDYFEAMCQIRIQLEALGSLLVCYGSSRNVYPSGMCRDMGRGLKAYKLRLGHQGKMADLVKILEVGPDVEPSTVADQREFFERWLKSLQ